ncbi:hypothetical protein AwWohl_13770 [Gammaproteobacteria bacterium]|nr:hypothetical protein AwWohl_13770 [Gammaproteobacteria bacterium]
MHNDTLNLEALQNVISSLEDALTVVGNSSWFNAQNSAVQNTLIAGVIQNFEFVYEISIKMIKRQLNLESASPSEVDETDFRNILRMAAEKGLIANVEAWFTYRKMRNMTSHTYDHAKAQQVYQGTLAFISDARNLLKKLEERNV